MQASWTHRILLLLVSTTGWLSASLHALGMILWLRFRLQGVRANRRSPRLRVDIPDTVLQLLSRGQRLRLFDLVHLAIQRATAEKAATVYVSVRRTDTALVLRVTDDGHPLSEAPVSEARSLQSTLRTHARAVGGTIDAQSGHRRGTTVLLTLPLAPPVPRETPALLPL